MTDVTLQAFPPIMNTDVRVRSLNWANLMMPGDTIVLGTENVVPIPNDGVFKITNVELNYANTAVNFKVTGGVPGTDYEIACTINTTTSAETVTRHVIQTVSDADL